MENAFSATFRISNIRKTEILGRTFGETFLYLLMEEHKVPRMEIAFYGVSGIGKTTLLREMLCGWLGEEAKEFCFGRENKPKEILYNEVVLKHADLGLEFYAFRSEYEKYHKKKQYNFEIVRNYFENWVEASEEICCSSKNMMREFYFLEHPWVFSGKHPDVFVFMGSRQEKKRTYDYFNYLHRALEEFKTPFAEFLYDIKHFGVLPKNMEREGTGKNGDRYVHFILPGCKKPHRDTFEMFVRRVSSDLKVLQL